MQVSKCLIIEKSDSLLSDIEITIKKLPFLSMSVLVSSYEEAVKVMEDCVMDVIIADTNSLEPGQLEILNSTSFPEIPVIIISDKPSVAVKCYDSGIPVDFILKPFLQERLMIGLNRALKQHISYKGMRAFDFLFLKMGRSYRKFLLDDIVYVEAYGIYIKVFTEKGKFTINDTISKLEERLQHYNFMRVHKSFIINTRKIVSFGNSYFELTLGNIPIGPNYKHKLEGLLNMLAKARVT